MIQDQPPPNTARVLLDAEIEVRRGQTVPVLAQPATQRGARRRLPSRLCHGRGRMTHSPTKAAKATRRRSWPTVVRMRCHRTTRSRADGHRRRHP